MKQMAKLTIKVLNGSILHTVNPDGKTVPGVLNITLIPPAITENRKIFTISMTSLLSILVFI
ncbi:hypothetical protein ACFL1A_01715 [Patescibacteria group bacterium]